MQKSGAAASDRDPSRADWMELFFDLIFVALVGQLAHALRTQPTFGELGVFVVLFASVWWSWVNLTFTVNVQEALTRRRLAGFMLAAMAAMGAIAVAAPDALGDRAWLFALGNAALRLIMLALWVRRSWAAGRMSRLRLLAYNGGTAVLWLASVVTPSPARYVVWAVAVVVEIVLLVTSAPGLLQRLGGVNIEHLADRFGTLVIIVLGESVLSVVVALDVAWTPLSAVTAALALAIATCLAWAMFMFGIDAMRTGLESLVARNDARGVVETVAFLPYLIVGGVTVLAGALSIAIAHPGTPLPAASALSLGAGVALFYGTNAAISLRYGTPARQVLVWALPDTAVPLAIGGLAVAVPAVWSVGAMAAVLVGVVAASERMARRRAAAPSVG